MDDYDTRGTGWLAFAGAMILLVGLLNAIFGIAAIADSHFFTDEGRYVRVTDQSAWGWVILIIGVMQLFAAFSIWSGNAYGRWLGSSRREPTRWRSCLPSTRSHTRPGRLRRTSGQRRRLTNPAGPWLGPRVGPASTLSRPDSP